MSSGGVTVCLEVLPKQTVAYALDWPGWCRAGRDEAAALEALAGYAPRYAPVARRAGVQLPAAVTFEVVERVPGGSPTAFAAPECRRPFPQVTDVRAGATGQHLTDLVAAAWATFDEIAAVTPAELRKGPRGGGRDRDQIVEHVTAADAAYGRKLGVKLRRPTAEELRHAIATALGSPTQAGAWPAPYAARRIAWHVLEHAWEMQDRAAS